VGLRRFQSRAEEVSWLIPKRFCVGSRPAVGRVVADDHGRKALVDLPGILNAPMMKPLTAFGLFAVTAMLVCYAFEKRNPWFILAFAVSCGLGSIYGFLQGAWPFGLIEAVWAVIAARRWRIETAHKSS
jgi:hypothetical protein